MKLLIKIMLLKNFWSHDTILKIQKLIINHQFFYSEYIFKIQIFIIKFFHKLKNGCLGEFFIKKGGSRYIKLTELEEMIIFPYNLHGIMNSSLAIIKKKVDQM